MTRRELFVWKLSYIFISLNECTFSIGKIVGIVFNPMIKTLVVSWFHYVYRYTVLIETSDNKKQTLRLFEAKMNFKKIICWWWVYNVKWNINHCFVGGEITFRWGVWCFMMVCWIGVSWANIYVNLCLYNKNICMYKFNIQ